MKRGEGRVYGDDLDDHRAANGVRVEAHLCGVLVVWCCGAVVQWCCGI